MPDRRYIFESRSLLQIVLWFLRFQSARMSRVNDCQSAVWNYDWECNNEVLRLVLENSVNKWWSIQETETMTAGDRHLSDTPWITKYVLTHILSHYFSNMKFRLKSLSKSCCMDTDGVIQCARVTMPGLIGERYDCCDAKSLLISIRKNKCAWIERKKCANGFGSWFHNLFLYVINLKWINVGF